MRLQYKKAKESQGKHFRSQKVYLGDKLSDYYMKYLTLLVILPSMGLEYSVFCVPPLPKQNLQSCDSVENESLNIFELSLKNP